jgi:hypothetical protein
MDARGSAALRKQYRCSVILCTDFFNVSIDRRSVVLDSAAADLASAMHGRSLSLYEYPSSTAYAGELTDLRVNDSDVTARITLIGRVSHRPALLMLKLEVNEQGQATNILEGWVS